jgi:RNA polymerase sigma-70 factor (ECF subfamily)
MNTLAVRPGRTTDEDPARAQRFRDAALPHLDAVYTLARYLSRSGRCGGRGARMLPAGAPPFRRARVLLYDVNAEPDQPEAAIPFWGEAQDTPETQMLRKLDAETIRGLLAALPEAFREAIVLREIQELSYREIAGVVGAPVGTVMSRLARGRAMLRDAWRKTEREDENTGKRLSIPEWK